MKTHDLKCHPHFFDACVRGDKVFEIRRNDRHYQVGDVLRLRKFDPSYGMVPGTEPALFKVTYIMTDEDFPAIAAGFVIMGMKPYVEDDFVKCDKCGAHYQPHYGHIACGIEGTGEDGWKDDAKPIGEVVAALPVVALLERCNEYRKVAGLVIPRTCQRCGLGPCQHPER